MKQSILNKYINKNITIPVVTSIALCLILLFPFVRNINTYYKDGSDYALNGWILKYNYDSIVSGRILNQEQYFQSPQFAPFPMTLAYSDNLIIPSLIFAPIFFITKNLVLSVNLYVLLTFILNFLAMYFVCYKVTKNINASIIGSSIYTFSPLVFAHLTHIQLMGRYFLPLLFFQAFRYINVPTYKNSLLFFLYFTLNALTSIYFFIFSFTLLSTFASAYIFVSLVLKKWNYVFKLAKTSSLLLLFLPFLIYFLFPYYLFSRYEGIKRSIYENLYFSARPLDWLSSTRESLLYGYFVKSFEKIRFNLPDNYQQPNAIQLLPYEEHTLFLNVLPILLFAMGIHMSFNKTGQYQFKNRWEGYLIYFIIISCLSYLLTIPEFFYLAYQVFPWLHGTRVPTRFVFIFYLGFCLFISYGYIFISNYTGRRNLLVFILLCIVVIENTQLNSYESKTDAVSDANRTIIHVPQLQKSTTIHYPINSRDQMSQARYLTWAAITGEKLVNGYSGYLPPDWVELMNKLQNLNKDNIRLLSLAGADYIVVHKKLLTITDLLSYSSQTWCRKNLIYEDQSIAVIDIKNYKKDLSICKDSGSQPSYRITWSAGLKEYDLEAVNSHNCYVINRYNQRYQRLFDIYTKKDINVVLPIIIYPNSITTVRQKV